MGAMDLKRRLSVVALIVMATPSPLQAMALRVGVSGSPPFVDKRGGVYEALVLKFGVRLLMQRSLSTFSFHTPI